MEVHEQDIEDMMAIGSESLDSIAESSSPSPTEGEARAGSDMNNPRLPYELLEIIFGFIIDDCQRSLQQDQQLDETHHDQDHFIQPVTGFRRRRVPPEPNSYGPQCTLSILSRVSKSLRETTLPLLYESVTLDSEEAFHRIVGSSVPSGWQYTRYLYLDDITYAQLKLHLRNVLDAFDGHNGDVNLRACFPLLVIAVVTRPSLYPEIHPRDDEIVVDLYETVTYDKLNELCTSPMVVSH